MSELTEWIRAHEKAIYWLSGASVVMFFGTIVAIRIVVVRMSATYFMPESERRFAAMHPVLRVTGIVLKNLLGLVMVVVGVALIFMPGQGLLTILLGIVLLDFPGKRRFELWLVSKKPVHESINWMRRRAGRGPLVLPE